MYVHGQMIDFLSAQKWSGNIRELENFIERLVALAPARAKMLDHDLLPKEYESDWKIHHPKKKTIKKSLSQSMNDYEAEIIKKTLVDNNWNQVRAARILKISEAAIRYKIKKLGIKKPAN
jgi:transcriptional regulator with PAS, ATPase and Fis domain